MNWPNLEHIVYKGKMLSKISTTTAAQVDGHKRIWWLTYDFLFKKIIVQNIKHRQEFF